MKKPVSLILASLLFVSVLSISLISASVLGTWFAKPTGNVIGTNLTTICNNGVMQGLERCDKTDFGGKTCQNFGYAGGTLSCSGGCMISLNGCTPTSTPITSQQLDLSRNSSKSELDNLVTSIGRVNIGNTYTLDLSSGGNSDGYCIDGATQTKFKCVGVNLVDSSGQNF